MIKLTGSTGFVGQNLTMYLDKNNIQNSSITKSELMEISANNLNGSLAIIHLAGKAHDLKKVSDPNEYYTVNYELTKRIYDAFLKSDAKKFIFISSIKAIADYTDEELFEDTVPNPHSPYGKSKLLAETYIKSKLLPDGKCYYILRPCMIHGPGNKGNLNLLYRFVKTRIPYPLAGYLNKRSILSVGNLCFVIKELITQESISSGVYHIADDEALSTNDVFSILSKALGKNAILWNIPKVLIQFIAFIGDKLNLPLNTERLTKLTENYVVSNKKIKDALQLDLPISTEEGLKITAASFMK